MRLGTRKWSLAGCITLLGTLALLVSACGGGTTPTSSDKAPDSQQVFHFVLDGESDIATMDPGIVQDANSIVPINMVWPALLTLDKSLSVQPWAASAMPTVDSTGTIYTFKIKPNLQFTDGEPIDANAFAYSINRSLDPCTASPVAYYLYTLKDAATFNGETCVDAKTDQLAAAKGQTGAVINSMIGDSLTVQDPQTLVITLAKPAAYFIEAITYPTSYAVPKNLITNFGAKWTDHLTDSGSFGGNLFNVSSWKHDGTLTLVRNDKFWGTKPVLKEVDFTIYKSVETQYNAFLSGQNELGLPPSAQYAAASKKADFHETGQLWIDYYGFNWKMAPFTDKGVRQAFDLALNKDALAKQVLHGTVNASNHIVPQGMPGYNANLTGPDGTQNLTGNVQAAQQAAAPYVQASCGGQYKNCPQVVLTYPTVGQDEQNNDQAALAMWQAAFPGWPIKLRGEDFNTELNDLAAHDLQAYSIAWIADYPDPQDWLTLQFTPGVANNSSNADDSQATALMNKADAEYLPSQQDQRMKDYNAAEQILVNDVAWCPLNQVKTYYELRVYVKNYVLDSQGLTPLADWENVYIAKH